MRTAFDFIIIGAGSAGCVLANRLSADASTSVLIIEAGSRRAGLYSAMPAGVYRAYKDPRINWNYVSEPEPLMDDRRIPVPRGKVVGGSSAINSMVYLRGQPQDYDGWEEAGAKGWAYADCLPYFRRSETSDTGANFFRGDSGPLSVERGKLESPIFDSFLASAEEAGHGISDDLNGAQPEGFARLQSTKRNGRRCSSAAAYLLPVLSRKNLELITDTHVTHIVVERGRAVGIETVRNGQREVIRANCEVLLCGGAINSPQILMLSGIGPADHLKDLGIGVVHDLPGVGANLQDHMDVLLTFRTRAPISIAWLESPLHRFGAGIRWLATGGGTVASNIFEVGGFLRSHRRVNRSNLQVHLAPVLFEDGPDGLLLSEGYTVHLSQLRQESRGTIRLRSPDPVELPKIRFNFLSTDNDKREFRDGIARIRELVATGPLAEITRDENSPGAEAVSDTDLDGFIRSRAETEYHPSCTCRIGTDPMAVVDHDLNVHGLTGLRVVDASVMPHVVSANLNGPTIMIAEKAADRILGKERLPPARLPAPSPATEP